MYNIHYFWNTFVPVLCAEAVDAAKELVLPHLVYILCSRNLGLLADSIFNWAPWLLGPGCIRSTNKYNPLGYVNLFMYQVSYFHS